MGLWAICGQFGGNMKANKEAARLGNMKIQTSRQHNSIQICGLLVGNMKVRKEAENWNIENTKQIKNRHIPEGNVLAFFF